MRAPFKSGIGRLIAEAQPVALPFYHYGMHNVLPIGAVRPRVGNQVVLRFGEPTVCDSQFIASCMIGADAGDAPLQWEALAAWAHGELLSLERDLNPNAGGFV
jgi:hypothetical protein